MQQEFKQVSVIIPTYNEEDTIIQCIESLLAGDYPVSLIEFIIADGLSTDKTVEKLDVFSKKNSFLKIKVFKNPNKTQGYGLNIAIKNSNSNSKIILRADAHSVYPKNYVRDCVETLLESGADNVGGVMFPVGKTSFQKAVAFCMKHPLGVGNAKFHLGNYSGFVDTVYIGCFKKEIFERVGLFDPLMTPNEDAEFNLRIAKSGGRIYLNGNIRVDYTPRDTFLKLVRQYFRYGQGRCRTVKKHSKFTSYRQIVPPLWVVTSMIFLVLSFLSKLFVLPVLLYLLIISAVSIGGALKNKDVSILFSSLCFVIMHYAWGTGFITELVKFNKNNNKQECIS